MLQPLDYIFATLAGWFVLHVVFEEPFTIMSVFSTFSGLVILGVLAPLVRVIICNYRKVPYHG